MGIYQEDPEGMWSGYIECAICGVSIDDRCNSMETLERTLTERWNTRYQPTCTMSEGSWGPDEIWPAYDYICSNCEEVVWLQSEPSYCPNCGARVVE